MLDWNWFFSSVAQSVAAIVGILAAFLITKIIANQSDFTRKRARINELIINSNRFRDLFANRYFKWYNDRTIDRDINTLVEDVRGSEKVESAEVFYGARKFSPFISRQEVIEKIKKALQINRRDETFGTNNIFGTTALMPSDFTRSHLKNTLSRMIIQAK